MFIKVCCILNLAEAEMAMRHGATALGLVSAMPSGPGVIEEAMIAQIAQAVRPTGVETFLLTSLTDPDAIVAQHHRCGTTAIQLTDAIAIEDYTVLRRELPGVKLIQVIHVEGEGSVAEAERVAPHVDRILLDSGSPGASVKLLGGTGRVHDWTHSRASVERASCPVILAGGLKPENVADAVSRVQPFGLDVCSGLRTEGRLNESKLATFINAARSADGAAR